MYAPGAGELEVLRDGTVATVRGLNAAKAALLETADGGGRAGRPCGPVEPWFDMICVGYEECAKATRACTSAGTSRKRVLAVAVSLEGEQTSYLQTAMIRIHVAAASAFATFLGVNVRQC